MNVSVRAHLVATVTIVRLATVAHLPVPGPAVVTTSKCHLNP